jgi:hypothetical protein
VLKQFYRLVKHLTAAFSIFENPFTKTYAMKYAKISGGFDYDYSQCHRGSIQVVWLD